MVGLGYVGLPIAISFAKKIDVVGFDICEIKVQQYKDGNSKLLGFFVGQVMKASQGKANPKQVNEILNEKLS